MEPTSGQDSPAKQESYALRGYGIGSGTAVAPVLHMAPPLPEPTSAPLIGSPAQAWRRVQEASAASAAALRDIATDLEGDTQEILFAAAMMAEDPAVLEDAKTRIEQGSNAERAVFDAYATFRKMLSSLGGVYADRAADLDDVSQRIRAHLAGVPAPGVPQSKTPFILVAKDLAPADAATLNFDTVKALVTEEGGPTGHTAILARSKGLPAVIGCPGALEIPEGATALVEARYGRVAVGASCEEMDEAFHRSRDRAQHLASVRGPGRLNDGTRVQLLANLGTIREGTIAVAEDAEGVGLLRTEFLFLESVDPPSRETQARAYRQLLEMFPGKKVVVRLLDAGADKPLPYLGGTAERNPALGVRGYRALRSHTQILHGQLAALADASQGCTADLWVMAPMINDAGEAQEFVQAGHEAGLQMVGVMAEVPSIALMAEQVVAVSDFISVGTNDLTQYTLAADRTLASMAAYQDPWHPAVLRLTQMLGKASQAADKPLGVCGEAAADPYLAAVMVGMGATSLSMAPDALAEVRLTLAQVSLEQCREAAEAACTADSAWHAREAAVEIFRG